MFLIRFLRALFKGPPKSGYSIRGFWGQMKHYNKDGVQIGYTVKGFWGQRKRFDMNHNLVSESWRNFWGGYNTYDAQGNLIRRSYRNFWGGYSTYNKHGKKITESYRNFWEGFNQFDVSEPDPYETYVVEKRSAGRSTSSNTRVAEMTNSSASSTSKTKTVIEPNSKTASSTVARSSSAVSAASSNSTSVKRTSTRNLSVKEEAVVKQGTIRSGSGSEPYSFSGAYARGVNGSNSRERTEDNATSTRNITYAPEKRNLNKEACYYSSIEEAVENIGKDKDISGYKKLLVFKYRKHVEFPAVAYLAGDMVRVEPLQIGIEPFSFPVSDVASAREEKITDMDMGVIDDEFLACIVSGVGREFEDLLPEYGFGGAGAYRNQYVLDSGMIITEKSLDELRKLCATCL